MKIDARLNLVFPLTRADGSPVFIHSTPINAEVFDAYFLVIAKTFSALYSEGLGAIAGPRVADKMLRKVATEMGVWNGGSESVQRGLVAEIHRLTNVFVPTDTGKGWETLPYQEAKDRGILTAEDASEVDAALCFFCVASAMHRKVEAAEILEGALSLWGAQISSLGCTEYRNSLSTSMTAASSGATVAA